MLPLVSATDAVLSSVRPTDPTRSVSVAVQLAGGVPVAGQPPPLNVAVLDAFVVAEPVTVPVTSYVALPPAATVTPVQPEAVQVPATVPVPVVPAETIPLVVTPVAVSDQLTLLAAPVPALETVTVYLTVFPLTKMELAVLALVMVNAGTSTGSLSVAVQTPVAAVKFAAGQVVPLLVMPAGGATLAVLVAVWAKAVVARQKASGRPTPVFSTSD